MTGDIKPLTTSIPFAPGETEKIINISVNDDFEVEGDEIIRIRLTPNNLLYLIEGAGSVDIILQDDDSDL